MCGSCNCNPCCCSGGSGECDPANEPTSSALNNFIASFFGILTKTCVDGNVVWTLPCDLEGGIPGFPRIPGEGIACYLVRMAESGVFIGPQGPPGATGYDVKACKVFFSVNQSIPNGAVPTVVTFDQEEYDTDNMHAPIPNPSRITINTAGKYLLQGQAGWADSVGIALIGSGIIPLVMPSSLLMNSFRSGSW